SIKNKHLQVLLDRSHVVDEVHSIIGEKDPEPESIALAILKAVAMIALNVVTEGMGEQLAETTVSSMTKSAVNAEKVFFQEHGAAISEAIKAFAITSVEQGAELGIEAATAEPPTTPYEARARFFTSQQAGLDSAWEQSATAFDAAT